MDWLEALPFDKILNGGGWAVAFWAVLFVARLVLKGDLVPRKTHEDTMEALGIERERNALLLERLEQVTDSMETFEVFLRALPLPQVTTLPSPPRGQRPRRDLRGGRADPGGDV